MRASMGHRYIWPVLTLLIFLAGLANTVQGSEMLQVTVDGRPVGDSIAMPYSGPEGDPVSALKVEVSGVSGPVRFAIDPAGADGCRGGEWEHASRDLMVAHDRQVNYYRAPASDWHPCSSARLGVIHDESGQEVWWTVSFTDGSVPPAPSSSRALYEIDPGLSSDMPLAAVEKVLYNGEEITPEHTILYEGSRIRTGPDVQITIRYSSGALVKLLSNSEMRIEPPTIIKDSISVMNSRLIDGILHYFGQSEKAKAEMKYEFETETAIVGIKGTLFTLTYEGGRTSLFVSEGEVEFTDKLTGRTSTVRGGEKAVSGAGQEVSLDHQNLALGKTHPRAALLRSGEATGVPREALMESRPGIYSMVGFTQGMRRAHGGRWTWDRSTICLRSGYTTGWTAAARGQGALRSCSRGTGRAGGPSIPMTVLPSEGQMEIT